MLRKICGYANLYIGVAEHEGERPANEVTLSIFRAVKNPELFAELERNGNLEKTAPGIYHVKGIVDLPFQIVITSELEGEEYIEYHNLTDKATQADIEHLIRIAGEAKDEVIREHYRVLLNLAAEKNPQYIDILRGEITVRDVLMEIVQEDVDKRVDERVSIAKAATKQETTVDYIKKMMANLKLTLEQAMDALDIPQLQRQTYAGLVQGR
ncbi:MAG: hypothetical protein IJU98_02995 [Synergistaceae bacterium]|nr:hypothetical protein [Synergistaceae bacterium]